MDALDRLADPAADLLTRVDTVLGRAGAPADHPIWAPLRRLGVLPGAAVGTVAALRPAPLAASGPRLAALAREYDETAAAIPPPSGWEGAAAEAYGARQQAEAAHLAGGADSLAGRLTATAAYAEALADWATAARLSVARTLAQVLPSAEAATLVTAGGLGDGDRAARPAPVVLAAAEIGARVLETVAEAYDRAEALLDEGSRVAAEVPYRPAGEASGPAGVLRTD
jgi:hypothetical protein